MNPFADLGAMKSLLWPHCTWSALPAPRHVTTVAVALVSLWDSGVYCPLGDITGSKRTGLHSSYNAQTFIFSQGIGCATTSPSAVGHHQEGCLSKWIATAGLPSEADRAMDLQPFDLHAPDLLGRRRHTHWAGRLDGSVLITNHWVGAKPFWDAALHWHTEELFVRERTLTCCLPHSSGCFFTGG